MDFYISKNIFDDNKELTKLAKNYCKENSMSIISDITFHKNNLKFFAIANKEDVEDFDLHDVIKFRPISFINFYLK